MNGNSDQAQQATPRSGLKSGAGVPHYTACCAAFCMYSWHNIQHSVGEPSYCCLHNPTPPHATTPLATPHGNTRPALHAAHPAQQRLRSCPEQHTRPSNKETVQRANHPSEDWTSAHPTLLGRRARGACRHLCQGAALGTCLPAPPACVATGQGRVTPPLHPQHPPPASPTKGLRACRSTCKERDHAWHGGQHSTVRPQADQPAAHVHSKGHADPPGAQGPRHKCSPLLTLSMQLTTKQAGCLPEQQAVSTKATRMTARVR